MIDSVVKSKAMGLGCQYGTNSEFDYENCDGGRSNYYRVVNVGDCVVRAIAIASGRDYEEVYQELKSLNKGVSCRNGTPTRVSEEWFRIHGWKWVACMRFGTGCTVHMRREELPSNKTIICRLSKHLVCVDHGVLKDTYDCTRDGNRCVYGFWIKPEEN